MKDRSIKGITFYCHSLGENRKHLTVSEAALVGFNIAIHDLDDHCSLSVRIPNDDAAEIVKFLKEGIENG